MRHALVVAPPFIVQGGGSQPPAPPSSNGRPDARAIADAFARLGARVVELPTLRELGASFDEAAFAIDRGDVAVVHVCARTTDLGEGGVAMRVSDAGDLMPLRALVDAVHRRDPATALFVIEARHDGPPLDAIYAAEHVDAIVRALDVRARGYSALIGVRSDGASLTAPNLWPFTRFVVRAIDDPSARSADGVLRISGVYERIRQLPETATFVQGYGLVKGKDDFVIVGAAGFMPSIPPPAPSMHAMSVPPPAVRSAPSSLPPPSAPPSLLPSARPQLMPLLLGADEARQREDWEEALDAYKKALMLVAPEDAQARATVYADIGEVKIAQDKPREAETFFEKALAARPRHKRSLEHLIALATAAKDVRRAIEFRKKLAATFEGDHRVAELVRIAEVLERDQADPRAAIELIEEALVGRHKDTALLARLCLLYETLHRWPKVIETLGFIADTLPKGRERASARFSQADVALGRLRDEGLGLRLLEQALDDDPTHPNALHAMVAVLSARQGWPELDALYSTMIDRFAKAGDKERAWDACRKLAIVRRDKLQDGAGAMEAFVGALACKPSDDDSRLMLAELHLSRGEEAAAVREYEAIARHSPLRASTYARLYSLHNRAGRRDRQWLAAQALEELAAAEVEHQLFIDQYRPDGQIRPTATLDDAAWDEWLRAPGADEVVTGILGAIVPAAVKMRVDEMRAARALTALDPSRRQPPTSTASIVRSFAWASQVLGVTLPELYTHDNVPGGIAAVRVETPSTALGPDVLKGYSAQELAFFAGRHLAYYRPEHYALVFFPSIVDLSTLFLAAVKLVMPDVPVPTALSAAVAKMRGELSRHVTAQEREWLSASVKMLDQRDGRVDLGAWIKSVELTAGRAGLLLTGDLRVAVKLVMSEERAIADLSADDRRKDMLAFSASSELASLREKLGIASRPSIAPPPTSKDQPSARPL